jgi:hypothetical protein
MKWDYPVFKVDEFFENKLPIFTQAVPEIDPSYFQSNSRFHSLGQVPSPSLVDYMGIYEEGDAWVLTVVKTIINSSTQYLFLPFTSDIPSSFSEPKNSNFGKPAFGFETNSPSYGKRQWQVFDAFSDYKFYQKLTNLFLPLEGVSENHVNAYVTVYKSGIGNFIFQTKQELKEPLYGNGKISYEFMESCFAIKWDNFHLDIFQTLPTVVNIDALEASPEVMGWITYSRKEDLQLIIGILYKSTNRLVELQRKITSWLKAA